MKADLHIHTNFSPDAAPSPKEVVEAALASGIDCICITDHGQIEGATVAMKYAFDKNLLVVPGIEILSTSGDILGINVKKVIKNGLSAEETIREIRQQGGIAVIPHPFDRPMMGFSGGEKKLAGVDFDAIEIFNASAISKSSNRKAQIFSQKNNLSFTAGSDAHRAQFVGRGFLELENAEKIFSENDLITIIKSKKAKIQGIPLSLWENIKNSSRADVKGIIEYWRFKKRNGRK